jgi:hypothetical protein
MKTKTNRDLKGRYMKRINTIGLMLVIGFVATSIAYALKGYTQPVINPAHAETTANHNPETSNNCVKVGDKEYDCTEDINTVKKWAAYERTTLQADVDKQHTMKAVITFYGRADSCHNPKVVNGKTLCLTAIGQDTQEGITVACPRSLKLGTKVEIMGHVYTCHDRYALRLDAQRGLPTFDVFYEAGSPKPPGRQTAEVKILD